MISDDILKTLELNKKVLVLTERKEHVEILNHFLKSKCEVVSLTVKILNLYEK